jgi:hypothetical protein
MARLLLLLACVALARCDAAGRPILPMTFREVALDEETVQAKAAGLNTIYMMDLLDADRLIWTFRDNAKLPSPGSPYAGAWGGAPTVCLAHSKQVGAPRSSRATWTPWLCRPPAPGRQRRQRRRTSP